jgi:hypothetical protein
MIRLLKKWINPLLTTVQEFKDLALSFPGTEERPHFDRTALKVIDKRIFAILHEPSESANIVLPVKDQAVFSAMSKGIYPFPNKWGTHDWTTFELKKISYAIVLV